MKFNIYVEGVEVPVHPIGRKNNTVFIRITGLDTEDIFALSVHIHDLYVDGDKANKDILNQYFKHDPEN